MLSLILFLTPLIMVPFFNDLYALPKAFLFWLVIPVFFIGANFAFRKEQIPVYLWAGFYFVSSVFSVCPFLSFVGNYRYYFHGFISLCAGFCLFMICGRLPTDKSKNLVKILILSLFGCSVIGFLQLPADRISSTFGNPNFFGGVLAAVLPFSVFLSVKDKRFLLFPAVFFAALVFTYSRASWLGAASGLLFLLIFSRNRKDIPKIFLIFLAVALAIALFAPSKGVSFFERVLSVFNFSEPDIASRLKGYAAAFEIFRSHPFFGQGPESFLLLFRAGVSKSFIAQIGPLAHAGYAHSYPLQILVDTGIAGAGLYLFLIFSILKKAVSSSDFLKLTAGSAVAAHFFGNLFAFPTVTEVMIFWFAAGIIFANADPIPSASGGANGSCGAGFQKKKQGVRAVTAVIFLAVILMPVVSESLFVAGMKELDGERALKFLKLSSKFLPQDFHLMNAGKKCIAFSQTLNKRLWLERAGYFFGKIIKRNPRNALAQNGCGFVSRELFFTGKDENNFKKAAECFEKAVEYDPFLSAAYLNLAVLYEKNNDLKKAREIYRRALTVYPSDPQFLFNCGVVSGNLGEYGEALELWRKLRKINPDYPKLDLYIRQAEKLIG
ncbi:MAG: O-antigen ligase family protein [bacterium]